MVATAFAGVANSGVLTVNAGGFNINSGAATGYAGAAAASVLRINAGGVVTITNSGVSSLTTDSALAVDGGVLIMTNNTGAFTVGLNGNNNGAGFTNSGGTVIISQAFQSRGRFTRVAMNGGSLDLLSGGGIFESSNDQERQFLINGGTANLGNFVVSRTVQTLASRWIGHQQRHSAT